jgi:predicted nucleic-acid-binding protein
MQKVDANIVLRYILNDHTELSPKAKGIIEQYTVEVPVEVLCEVVYVLTGYYKIDRKVVSIELGRFIEQTQCVVPHQETVLQALVYFGETVLDCMRRVHTPPFRALIKGMYPRTFGTKTYTLPKQHTPSL